MAAFEQRCVAASSDSAEKAALTKAVDQLCSLAGMTRLQALQKIESRPTNEYVRYKAEACLAADGRTSKYIIRFHSKTQVIHFMPEHFDLDISLGGDTLKDSQLRAKCLEAVAKVNRGLGWKWAVGPSIQRLGPNFIVTFETVTAAQQKKAKGAILDPYVSFVVTRRGIVIGGFWGS